MKLALANAVRTAVINRLFAYRPAAADRRHVQLAQKPSPFFVQYVESIQIV